MIVTVKEMKNYLRVDFEDDDRLLADLIEQGQQLCMDVARISDEDVFSRSDGRCDYGRAFGIWPYFCKAKES